MLPSTRKRQNHNLDKKMVGANETKTATQSLAAEEILLSIVTYKEGEMVGSITSRCSGRSPRSSPELTAGLVDLSIVNFDQ